MNRPDAGPSRAAQPAPPRRPAAVALLMRRACFTSCEEPGRAAGSSISGIPSWVPDRCAHSAASESRADRPCGAVPLSRGGRAAESTAHTVAYAPACTTSRSAAAMRRSLSRCSPVSSAMPWPSRAASS